MLIPFYYKRWYITFVWIILIITYFILGYQANYAINNPDRMNIWIILIVMIIFLIILMISLVSLYNGKYKYDIKTYTCYRLKSHDII